MRVGRYTADFTYRESGLLIVADSKGRPIRDSSLRKKLMLAPYGIEILELRARPARRHQRR